MFYLNVSYRSALFFYEEYFKDFLVCSMGVADDQLTTLHKFTF